MQCGDVRPATAPRGCSMSEQVVYLDGRFLPEPEARVPLLTHAVQYGTGVFEGIRAYHDPHTSETLLFRATDHFERMTRNVRFLSIDSARPATARAGAPRRRVGAPEQFHHRLPGARHCLQVGGQGWCQPAG